MKCALLRSTAQAPVRKTEGAAGYDLHYDGEVTSVLPGTSQLLGTGIQLEIQSGYYGQIAPRSGLAISYGIAIMGGIIDSDYRGEVKVIVQNLGCEPWHIQPGDRVAQLLILPCYQGRLTQVESLTVTERGAGGFGSTGQ